MYDMSVEFITPTLFFIFLWYLLILFDRFAGIVERIVNASIEDRTRNQIPDSTRLGGEN